MKKRYKITHPDNVSEGCKKEIILGYLYSVPFKELVEEYLSFKQDKEHLSLKDEDPVFPFDKPIVKNKELSELVGRIEELIASPPSEEDLLKDVFDSQNSYTASLGGLEFKTLVAQYIIANASEEVEKTVKDKGLEAILTPKQLEALEALSYEISDIIA